jgi:Zn-dependent protease/CBS domain-containing protein
MKPLESPRSRWSWKVGEAFGIAIRVHVTLVVLLAWVAASYAIRGEDLGQAALGVVLIGLAFVIVVLHELGHALVARRYGCRTAEILLLPIGGLARMDRMPERPLQELLVALAGPAVNVGLALGLAIVVAASGASFDPAHAATIGGALVSQLLWINIALAVFNLLPAFPMDGGRVLRALLAFRLGRDPATRIAGRVGRVLGGMLAVAGLFFNPMLIVIGAFVWLAARQEIAMLELRTILDDVTSEHAMIRNPEVVDAGESIERAADRMLAAGQVLLPVRDGGRLVGIVTAVDLASSLAGAGPRGTVASIVRTGVPAVAPDHPLVAAMTTLERTGVAFVVDRGELVGLLTLDQLETYAAFHAHRTDPPARLPMPRPFVVQDPARAG